MKTIDVPPATAEKFELVAGDLLVCEGNSRELVGRPAIWQGEIEGCVHQNHILRVRLNTEKLLPAYVFAYMHGPAGRWYFDEAAKQTTNLATINSTDLKAFPIPVPDLTEQAKLAEGVSDARRSAEDLRAEAMAIEKSTEEWLARQIGSSPPVENDDEDENFSIAEQAG